MMRNRRGQMTAETAVLFAFVIAGFIGMGFYLQRGVQGSTKSNADSIGQPFATVNSAWASYSASDTAERAGGVTGTASCSSFKHTPGDPTAIDPLDPTDMQSDCADGIGVALDGAQVAGTTPAEVSLP